MKKTILILLNVISFSFLTIAQEIDVLKPTSNDVSFEVSFYPNNSIAPINLNYLRGRYFMNDKIAIRMGIDLANKKQKTEYVNNYTHDGNPIDVNNDIQECSCFLIGIHPGIELHLSNSKRLSPYIGVEISYITKSSNEDYEDYYVEYDAGSYTILSEKTKYEGAWMGNFQRAYSKFGVNALLGTDFYVTKHLYLGFEIGIGLLSCTNNEITKKVDDDDKDVVVPESKYSDFGVNVNNAIRLGFWF
ncbi:MAG: hypothetical protein KAT68_02055 [Bacteroidales bacterium]|nr:hypothetical protein [Bacteroidales bacterium]